VIKKYGLDFIFLVTPETSEERIRRVDALGTGFLYAVSSSSTTGKNKDLEEQQAYFERLQQMGLRNPVLVGFSIRDKASFEAACRYTNGAIIGTAYIRALENAATAAAAGTGEGSGTGTGEGSGAAGDKGGDADIAGATKQFLSSILT
jgi:tryptophan synthase alpha chain